MNTRKNAPIAVFDSGIGGLSVLRALRRRLPHEDLLYFGDSANAPYGEKTHEQILALVTAHAARLLEHEGCKALVLACNTATAVAASDLRQRYPDVLIIGIEPALRPALGAADHPRILVLATATTLREQKFETLLSRCEEKADVICLAAPQLVRLVETGHTDDDTVCTYLSALLAPFSGKPFDAAVLGCTHFPFAAPAIRAVLGAIPLFDGADGTARETARRLAAAELLHDEPHHGNVTLTSSSPAATETYKKIIKNSL